MLTMIGVLLAYEVRYDAVMPRDAVWADVATKLDAEGHGDLLRACHDTEVQNLYRALDRKPALHRLFEKFPWIACKYRKVRAVAGRWPMRRRWSLREAT